MDGLFRCLAVPVPFAINPAEANTTVMLRPLTLRILAICEAFVIQQQQNPVDTVVELSSKTGLADEFADRLLEKAYQDIKKDKALRVVAASVLWEWLWSNEGIYHSVWHCLDHPAAQTLPGAMALVHQGGRTFKKRFVKARDSVSGLDVLASADWPDMPAQRQEQSTRVKYFPWRRVLRFFGEQYHWTPAMVGELTLYALKIFLADERELGGTTKVDLATLRRMREKA